MSRLCLAAIIAVLVFCGGPAFANCNPGSPNCQKIYPGSRLYDLKKKMANPGEVGGDDECQGVDPGHCDIHYGDLHSNGAVPVARTVPRRGKPVVVRPVMHSTVQTVNPH